MTTLNDILRQKQGDPLLSIEQEASVLEAVQMMNERSVGSLIVRHDGQMAGIFTERDVLRRVVGGQLDPAGVRVAQAMTTRVICCTPETSIEEARELMKTKRVRHLPVLDSEGEPVGVVSIGDLNAHLTNHQEVTIHYLHEYLHGRV
ncbi:MAG TPA: CBS domain-containing protein [Planctomycetaceae bacterium]|nr:CBS domain-containing protein [Planctomycetaceae bacterium]